MRFLIKLLIFSIPLTLFSVNLGGLEVYPAFFLAPFGFVQIIEDFRFARIHIMRVSTFVLILFLFLILANATGKAYLRVDVIKIIFLVVVFQSLRFVSRHYDIDIRKILNYSLLLLVIYALFQMLAALAGYNWLAMILHNVIHKENQGGGSVDQRGFGLFEYVRVASLTSEPSYFAFTSGIYYFLAKEKWAKRVSMMGIILSFSLITFYAFFGLAFYRFLKFFRLPSWVFFALLLTFHLLFVVFILREVPQVIGPTFDARYAGLVGFLDFEWAEIIWGAHHVDANTSMFLVKPYSNISSVVYQLGLVGYALYISFFYWLERHTAAKYATVLLFLYMFNYYYLTAWPTIVAFLFLIYEEFKKPRRELSA